MATRLSYKTETGLASIVEVGHVFKSRGKEECDMYETMCLLSSSITPVGVDAWQSVIDALTAQVSVSTVVAVLASAVAACVGLVFMWWGLRKVTKAIMAAFKSGRLSF